MQKRMDAGRVGGRVRRGNAGGRAAAKRTLRVSHSRATVAAAGQRWATIRREATGAV